MTQSVGPQPEQAATRLLLRQRLNSLCPDITRLRFEKDIVFDTVQNFCVVTRTTIGELARDGDTRDGLTLVRRVGAREVYVVLYNADTANLRRRSFTLAHEVGHICLGHTDDGPKEEREADAFAAQLLLPRVLVAQLVRLWGGRLTDEELCGVFGVSRAAARARLVSLDSPDGFTDDDFALLRRFGRLLPTPHDPLVTV